MNKAIQTFYTDLLGPTKCVVEQNGRQITTHLLYAAPGRYMLEFRYIYSSAGFDFDSPMITHQQYRLK